MAEPTPIIEALSKLTLDLSFTPRWIVEVTNDLDDDGDAIEHWLELQVGQTGGILLDFLPAVLFGARDDAAYYASKFGGAVERIPFEYQTRSTETVEHELTDAERETLHAALMLLSQAIERDQLTPEVANIATNYGRRPLPSPETVERLMEMFGTIQVWIETVGE